MYEDLKIILYPDPRLKKLSKPVTKFEADLVELTARMFQLMRESKGVGLAAPQVGINLRLFVMNPTGKPEDDRIYVNPSLLDADGDETAEEGCLSLPDIHIDVTRAVHVKMVAQDVTGKSFEQVEAGYIPRIWQHEFDHLNGVLLTDRMGPSAKVEYRKKLRDLEDQYAAEHPPKPAAKRSAPRNK